MTNPTQELRYVLVDAPTTPRESALIEALMAVQSADSILERAQRGRYSPQTIRNLIADAREHIRFALSVTE